MMADGRDMSDLFAAIVKNVVSKNVEVLQCNLNSIESIGS